MLNCIECAVRAVRCSVELSNWCYILKLGLRCEQGAADGSAAHACVCVDAEVGGQLCIGCGVSGLRQAIMLSTMGRTWLAEVWRQTGIAASDIMDQRCWQELKTVAKDKGLEALSEHAESLVMDTHAAATVRAYEGAYGRWRQWAD